VSPCPSRWCSPRRRGFSRHSASAPSSCRLGESTYLPWYPRAPGLALRAQGGGGGCCRDGLLDFVDVRMWLLIPPARQVWLPARSTSRRGTHVRGHELVALLPSAGLSASTGPAVLPRRSVAVSRPQFGRRLARMMVRAVWMSASSVPRLFRTRARSGRDGRPVWHVHPWRRVRPAADLYQWPRFQHR